jgi:Tol biopolymer transport system component
MTRLTLLFAAVLLVTTAGSAQAPISPEALLRAAQQKEQIDGDRAGALAMYETLVAQHAKHPAAADALLRLAGIYDDQGNVARARAALMRVVNEFAGLSDRVRQANALLARLDRGVIDRRVDWPTTARMAGDVSFSPDGRYISYTDQTTGELAIRDLRTGQSKQMTNIARTGGYVEYSAISRDGRFVAFVAYENGRVRRGLRLLPITATAAAAPTLLIEGDWIAPRGWMPGDREIFAYILDGPNAGPAVIRVSDRSVRRLQPVPRAGLNSNWAVSPDGAFVATHARAGTDSTQHDMYLIPTDGGAVRHLLPGASNDAIAGWSPDGRHLVFSSDREGSKGRGLWALPIADGRAAGAPILLRADFQGGHIGMSSAGALLYETAIGGREERTLLVATIEPETGKVIDPPAPAAHDRRTLNLMPRWSGDGKWFIYVTERPGGRVLSIRATNSRVTREIPRALSYVWTYEVSPDGRAIAFRATSMSGDEGIYLLDTQTATLRTVALKQGRSAQPDGIGYYRPEFSLDGTKLFYSRVQFEGGKAVRMQELERDLATWEERVIAEPTQAARLSSMRSPDRSAILFLANQPVSTISVQDGPSAPARVVFRAERPNAIDGNTDLRWMPDGRSLLVKVAGTVRNERWLWWVPLDGRPARRIELGRTDLVDTGIAVHPDGRQIAFVAGDPIVSKTSSLDTEFRLLENFLPADPRRR